MVRHLGFTCILSVMLPLAATAEPVRLKLSYFSSDRSVLYRATVQPFFDAVKVKGEGLIDIEPHFSGALGKQLAKQLDLLLDDTTDIVFAVPSMTRDRFPGNSIIEMPGLYKSMREATQVFTRLIAAGTLKDYDDFFAIGAYATEPETVHGRTAITSLDDLKGKKIRVNNAGEAAGLQKLGAIPIQMPVNQIAEALGGGRIDAALVPPGPLRDFGIKRIATYHYLLGTSSAPLVLLMNRKKFANLPKPIQELIREHSGQWAADRFVEIYGAADREIMQELKSEPNRRVIIPSARDIATAQAAFKSVLDEWVAADPRNSVLLKAAESELAIVRRKR